MIANSGNTFTLGHITEVSTTKRIMKKCHPPSGQTCRVLSHLLMQWKWKAWLQTPGQHSHKHYRHNITEKWRKKNVNSLQVMMHPDIQKGHIDSLQNREGRYTPCHSALLTSCTGLICLAFNTWWKQVQKEKAQLAVHLIIRPFSTWKLVEVDIWQDAPNTCNEKKTRMEAKKHI